MECGRGRIGHAEPPIKVWPGPGCYSTAGPFGCSHTSLNGLIASSPNRLIISSLEPLAQKGYSQEICPEHRRRQDAEENGCDRVRRKTQGLAGNCRPVSRGSG